MIQLMQQAKPIARFLILSDGQVEVKDQVDFDGKTS